MTGRIVLFEGGKSGGLFIDQGRVRAIPPFGRAVLGQFGAVLGFL